MLGPRQFDMGNSGYNVSKLVFWEATESLESARAREKQIKGWRRSKKVELIEEQNPHWSDLSVLWSENPPPQALRPRCRIGGEGPGVVGSLRSTKANWTGDGTP